MASGQVNQQQSPVVSELQGVIVFQAHQIVMLTAQLQQAQQALGKFQQVLANSEAVAAKHAADAAALREAAALNPAPQPLTPAEVAA